MGAANRDGSRCRGPDRFDILRAGLTTTTAFSAAADHLAFALGRHFRVGALPAKARCGSRPRPERHRPARQTTTGVNTAGRAVSPRIQIDGRQVSSSGSTARTRSGRRSSRVSTAVRAMTSASSGAG